MKFYMSNGCLEMTSLEALELEVRREAHTFHETNNTEGLELHVASYMLRKILLEKDLKPRDALSNELRYSPWIRQVPSLEKIDSFEHLIHEMWFLSNLEYGYPTRILVIEKDVIVLNPDNVTIFFAIGDNGTVFLNAVATDSRKIVRATLNERLNQSLFNYCDIDVRMAAMRILKGIP